MSDEEIEYCPWCGAESVGYTVQHEGHMAYQARKCGECGKIFTVKVPSTRRSVEWTSAQ